MIEREREGEGRMIERGRGGKGGKERRGGEILR